VKPLLVLLAGPNGAGKSTFYEAYLSSLGLPFLNADVLAAITGMGAYEAAARVADARRLFVERSMGFITETVLSDPVGAKVEFLVEAAAAGFDVQLIYIGIGDADLAAERVASRVRAGGHDVPLDKILARYARTLDNLEKAIIRLPRVTLFDNSSFDEPFRFIAEFRNGKLYSSGGNHRPRWALRFFQE
jgi:predicted ABC-type ATPase